MTVINLRKGIKDLKDFIKKASKYMPDRNNRGFVDSICYLNDILDGIDDMMKYVDDPMLNYYKKNKLEELEGQVDRIIESQMRPWK
tara:strand:+ start:135 stop:392 length:258 start_codon:yes stop_codon:yes gene_type:complete